MPCKATLPIFTALYPKKYLKYESETFGGYRYTGSMSIFEFSDLKLPY